MDDTARNQYFRSFQAAIKGRRLRELRSARCRHERGMEMYLVGSLPYVMHVSAYAWINAAIARRLFRRQVD